MSATANNPRPGCPLRRALAVVAGATFLYVGSYAVNSRLGGYWNDLERDGRDRWSMGLSMRTAILWQPRIGYWAPYRSDLLGSFYSPLIRLDQRYVHPTRYISDPAFIEWARTASAKDWHPRFRTEIADALTGESTE